MLAQVHHTAEYQFVNIRIISEVHIQTQLFGLNMVKMDKIAQVETAHLELGLSLFTKELLMKV